MDQHRALAVLAQASDKTRFELKALLYPFKYQSLKPGDAFKLGSSLRLRPHLARALCLAAVREHRHLGVVAQAQTTKGSI